MQSTQPVSIRRKWNAVLTVFFFIIMFLPVSTYAQDTIVDYDYTQEITDLTKNYDSILDYTESKRCIAYSDQDKTLCSTYEDTILYLYKTNTSAPPGVINKNTEQLNDTTYKIYSSDVYYQDEQTNSWKQTEYGVIERMDFQAVQDYKLKTIDEVSLLNNPFKIYKVNAQSPIYPGVDGWTTPTTGGSWSQVRGYNGASGDWSTEDLWVGWQYSSQYIRMYRTRLTFDTSALSGSVSSSTLMIKAKSSYGSDTTNPDIAIYGLNPANETTGGNSDFENSQSTLFSNKIAKNSMTNDTMQVFKLITAGKNNIDVDGYSHFSVRTANDAEDVDPLASNHNAKLFYNSETSGIASDSYLLVETGEAEPACEDAECNGDETCETCPEDCGECAAATTTLSDLPELPFIDDLTIITGRTDHYESSTTAADWSELHYYRVPSFLWWILTSTFLFILGFILSQIQRILRKKK